MQAGQCCRWEAPARRPFFHRHWKRANFHRGAALARISTSGSLSPLQVPRPRLGRARASKQPPGAFLQPSTPHPAPTTLWPLNTLVSPMHPGFFCLPSKWLAGERDEMSRTQVYLWTQHWVSSPLFIPMEFESSKKDLLPKVQMVLPDCMLQTPSAESCSPVYVHAKNFYIRGDLPW